MKQKTVKDLKELLSQFPDDLPVSFEGSEWEHEWLGGYVIAPVSPDYHTYEMREGERRLVLTMDGKAE